jgi:hypothetical protein
MLAVNWGVNMQSQLSNPKLNDLLANFDKTATLGMGPILNDRPSLMVLRSRFEDRSCAYGEASRLFSDIPCPGELCVLIDFDVLCAYIKGEPAGKIDAGEIRFFFERSALPYRIPLGAFEELRKYLERERFFELRPESHAPLTIESLLFSHDAVTEDSATFEKESLERLFVRLELLRSVLDTTNGRFLGKAETYDSDTFEICLERLERYYELTGDMSRRGGRREENNKHDAKNLAIALRPWDATEPDNSVFYLLLTATDGVQETAKEVEIRLKAAGHRVAISPSQAALIELFDYIEDPSTAQAHAREYRDTFQKMADQLSDQLQALEDPENGDPHPSPEFIESELRHVFRKLSRQHFGKIEQQRTSFFGTAHSSLGFYSDARSHDSFIKTIDGLRKILDGLSLVTYKHMSTQVANNLRRFEIRENDPFTDEPLCIVDRLSTGGSSCQWKMYWRLDETQDALVSFLDKYIQLFAPDGNGILESEHNKQDVTIAIHEAEISPSVLHNGIIIAFPNAFLVVPSHWIYKHGNTAFLRYFPMKRMVLGTANREADSERRKVIFTHLEHGLEVQKIELNFANTRIVFECQPSEGAFYRKCEVFMETPDLEFLSTLFGRLGSRVIMSEEFARVLRSIFSN